MAWIKAQEAATLTAYDLSTIQKKCRNGEFGVEGVGYCYITGVGGRGGRSLYISHEVLPKLAQRAYLHKNDTSVPFFNEAVFTAAQRERAEHKKRTVQRYEQFCKEQKKLGRPKGEIMTDFLSQYHLNHPDRTITAKTLYEWVSKAHSGDPHALIDGRGGYNRGTTSISPKLWGYFKGLYLQLSKPTMEDCYNVTRLEADRLGMVIPGRKAFELAVDKIPYGERVLYREGPKAFDDKCLPYVERDYRLLHPNQQWVSDHHLWDVFVRVSDGKGGWKAERPWGSYWMDMCTRKVMSSFIRVESPNSDIVLCSFGEGVKPFGIPEEVLLDNGKDYKSNDLFSKHDEEQLTLNLCMNLQIKSVFAIPYNAKAKPIERLFNTFESQFGKKFPTYAGSNAKERPELLKDLNVMEYPTLEEFVELHNRFVYEVYNNTPHSGDGMDNFTPNMVYASRPFTIRKIAPEVLQLCLMRIKGTRVVQRNGITFNGCHYYMGSDNLNYIEQKVLARYSPYEPDKLYIYDTNDNFITIANKVVKQGFDTAVIDFAAIGQRRKEAKATVQHKQQRQTAQKVKTIVEQQAQAAAQAVPVQTEQTTVEMVRNAKMEENARRISIDDMERQYQDNLAKQAQETATVDQGKQRMMERFVQHMLSPREQDLKEAASR